MVFVLAARQRKNDRRARREQVVVSFEKMALHDAVRVPSGARAFADGLFALVYGARTPQRRFDACCEVVAALPRKQRAC